MGTAVAAETRGQAVVIEPGTVIDLVLDGDDGSYCLVSLRGAVVLTDSIDADVRAVQSKTKKDARREAGAISLRLRLEA